MLLSLLATGVFFFVTIGGQDHNCNFDPDLIYFDNEELQRLKNMFRIGGDCSPIVWKDFDQVGDQIRDERQNDRDQISLKQLKSYEPKSINKNRKLSINNGRNSGSSSKLESKSKPHSLPLISLFTPHAQRTSNKLGTPNETRRKRQIQWQPKLFRPHNQWNRRSRQNHENIFTTGIERPLNEERLEDVFEYEDEDYFPPEELRNSQNQRRSQNENAFFGPRRQRRPQGQERPESFFTQNNQRRPQNQNSVMSFDGQRRPQNQRRPDDFFSPQNQRDPFTTEFQGSLQNQRRPGNFFPSQDQGDFFPGGRPEIQRRPDDTFGPRDQRRPQSQGSQNDIFSDNPRRPFRPDTFRPDRQRPQNDGGDFFGPGNQPGSQVDPSGVFGNSDRPQTTTRRPESTTLPGPPTWATPPSICVRNCPNTPEYNPVCGSDRVTYRNPGRLRCEQRCGKASVNINHYGNCITTTAMPATTTTTSSRTTSTTTFRPPATTPPTFSRNLG